MNKKYQVFISSTFTDLQEERKKVIETLLIADCIPAGMEAFVATDSEQFEVIKKVIDLCDYYILIIGKRYGSVNNSTGLSYTEMEYEYAKFKEIPVLVFAIDATLIKEDESSDNLDKLMAFRAKAMENRLGSIWKDVTDLIRSVALAIMKAEKEIPRSGWKPATDYDETSLLKQVLQLQAELEKVKNENIGLTKTIESFSESSDLAFEDGNVVIRFLYQHESRKNNASFETNFESLFKYISLELFEIPQSEFSIDLIIKIFLEAKFHYKIIHLNNSHLVRELMIQFRGLNLVHSIIKKDQNDQDIIYWELTEKGERIGNELTYIRK